MGMLKTLAIGCAVIVLSLTPAISFAQSKGGCIVEEAAQAALDRELALIKELAADPEDSFSGPESCINGDIFSSIDISNLIPDFSGMLSSFSADAINQLIAKAQSQVCKAIGDAINDKISDVTSMMGDFKSDLSGELQGILDNGWDNLKL